MDLILHFYEFWGVIKSDVMPMVIEFYNNGVIPKSLLSYFVTLIIKVSRPQHIGEFRPISLLGCLYKIVSKQLEDRLKLVLGAIIYDQP